MADQLVFPLDGFTDDATGPASSSLVRSIAAAAAAGRLAASDEAAAVAALHLARALDLAVAGHAPLAGIVTATGALRAWYVALGLTPAIRDTRTHDGHPNGSADPAWAGFGTAEVRDAAVT